MRSLLAVVFAALVGAAGLSAAQTTTWSWQGLDTNSATNSAGASIGFSRQGSGPLHLEAASAVVACPQSRARQEFNLSLRNAGITVNTDGTFTYDGPAEEIEIGPNPTNPRLQISGRLSGRTITGSFRIGADVQDLGGAPCHAQSTLVKFTAACTSGCPAVVRQPPPRLPVTVFPGIGIGGPGLQMRGVARFGMTVAQVRALNRSKPSRSGRNALEFRYSDRASAAYFFTDTRVFSGLSFMILTGKIRMAGVATDSTEAQLVRAYPRARCKKSEVFADPARECNLLRGTVARGVLTKFVLGGVRGVYSVALFDCVALINRPHCLKAVGP